MTSVPAGMLATGRLSYNSQSSTTTSKISDSLEASYGLQKLSAAMEKSHSASDTAVSLDFVLEVEGGGPAASQLLTDMASPIANYLASCATGSAQGISDCNSFASAADAAVSKAIGTFSASVPTMTDYTSFAIFPKGVQGVALPGMIATSAYATSDFLGPYATQMNQTMTLLNQISNLDNRVNLYLRPAVSTGSFNPRVTLDLMPYLVDDLHYNYSAARTALYKDLSACLEGSKSKSVDTDCAGVVYDSKFLNAYDCFASSGPGGGDWMSQQNTIALQWTGTLTCLTGNCDNYAYWLQPVSVDFIYVDSLPPFTNTPGQPIGNSSALVSIVDQPWGGSGQETTPDVRILPMTNNVDLGSIYSSITTSWWVNTNETFCHADDGKYTPGGPLVWSTGSCKPKIDRPCTLGMTLPSANPSSLNFSLSLDPISNFFTP